MWHYFDQTKFYETEFQIASNMLKSYFKSIKTPLYSVAHSQEKTEYEKNLEKIQKYFSNSGKCLEWFKKFNIFLRNSSFIERENLRKIIDNNLNIVNYLKNSEFFISYNKLKDFGFSMEFITILVNLDTALWEYLKSKEKGKLTKEYYEMLYKSLNSKIYCPFCSINKIKDFDGEVKLSPLEHFIPKSKYPFMAWNIDNIFLSCEDCNSKKGAKILKEKNSFFFPTKSYVSPKLKLISYELLDDSCEIKFEEKNISKNEFDKYFSTWNYFFDIEKRLKKELAGYIKKKEREFLRKTEINSNFDFLTDIEVELEEAEKDGNIIKIAYLKYKEDELKNN